MLKVSSAFLKIAAVAGEVAKLLTEVPLSGQPIRIGGLEMDTVLLFFFSFGDRSQGGIVNSKMVFKLRRPNATVLHMRVFGK